MDIRKSAKLFECTWTKQQTKFKLHVDYLLINIISYNAKSDG